jgi:hypothetical protein
VVEITGSEGSLVEVGGREVDLCLVEGWWVAESGGQWTLAGDAGKGARQCNAMDGEGRREKEEAAGRALL